MQEVLEEGGDEEEEAAEEVVCCSTNAICQYSQHLIQGGMGVDVHPSCPASAGAE